MGLVNVEIELLRVHADMRAVLVNDAGESDSEVLEVPKDEFSRWMRTLFTCSKDLELNRKLDNEFL
jgi:hypothetical protein